MVFFCFNYYFSQSKINGKVVNVAEFSLSNVLVVNTTTGSKSFSDQEGNFVISAKIGDELRFVAEFYEREVRLLSEIDFEKSFQITMLKLPYQIQEVKVGYKPSGNLKKDAKMLAKEDKVAKLQKDIGLPKFPEKPREKPAKLGKDVLLPMIGIPPTLKIQAIYDVISGKARRQKNLYKYEDFQENITWIRKRLPDDYFFENKIPNDKIADFLVFSIAQKPEILKSIKSNNLTKVMVLLEEMMTIYLQKLKN